MSRERGFLQLRRGVFQHVRDGWLSPLQALVFIYMLTQADTRSGVWKGGAGALAGELSIPVRTARRALEALDGRYLKRFPVPGSHKCYPILLHKFLITDGEHAGQQLNALDSASPVDLRYFASEQDGEQVAQHLTSQKKLETGEKRKKKNLAAKIAPPADPRFGIFRDIAYEAYRAKHGQPPTWNGKDWASLKRFLAAQPQVTLEEFERRFGNYMQSTEQFTRSHGDSLAYFVAAFDRFLDGPVLERAFAGGKNGHYESFDERRKRKSMEAICDGGGNFEVLDAGVVGNVPQPSRNPASDRNLRAGTSRLISN
jgi:hypothetical protein